MIPQLQWKRVEEELYSSILPWPLPKLPVYRPGTVRNWRCLSTPAMQHLTSGYFLPHQEQPKGWMFHRDGKIWMSLTKMEVESQMAPIASAHGHTVIAGLGMGFVLFNIIAKPEVTKVTLLEIDPNVVALMNKVTKWREWPGFDKVTIVMGDATEWRTDETVDFLFADIWQHLGAAEAVRITQEIQRGAKAALVSYWGQEFDFVNWLADQDIRASTANLSHYRRFAGEIGLPLIERHRREYPFLAVAAVTLQIAAKEKGPNKAVFQLMAADALKAVFMARL